MWSKISKIWIKDANLVDKAKCGRKIKPYLMISQLLKRLLHEIAPDAGVNIHVFTLNDTQLVIFIVLDTFCTKHFVEKINIIQYLYRQNGNSTF